MTFRVCATTLTAVSLLCLAACARAADNPDDAAAAAVRKADEQLVTAFNAAKTDQVTGMFLPKGELIDEEGTVYQGAKEIGDLVTAFYKKYPETKLSHSIESVRIVGPVAIEEGTRMMVLKDGETKSKFRFISIWTKTDKGWQIASFRDFADDPTLTPHEQLSPVAWMVGEWVNEGTDGKVAISYKWSEDKNYLLGEFSFQSPDGTPRKSSQRIGWDPAGGKIHSWLFDADGGFGEGCWTVLDDSIVIKSSTTNPNGECSSATLTIKQGNKDRFTITGTERIVGDHREPDFELNVTHRPPNPTK